MKKPLGFGLAAILSLSVMTSAAWACGEREIAPEQVPSEPAVYTLRMQLEIEAPDTGEGRVNGDVRAAVKRLSGVKAVEVNLKGERGKLVVRFNPKKVSRAAMVRAVEAAGYRVRS